MHVISPACRTIFCSLHALNYFGSSLLIQLLASRLNQTSHWSYLVSSYLSRYCTFPHQNWCISSSNPRLYSSCKLYPKEIILLPLEFLKTFSLQRACSVLCSSLPHFVHPLYCSLEYFLYRDWPAKTLWLCQRSHLHASPLRNGNLCKSSHSGKLYPYSTRCARLFFPHNLYPLLIFILIPSSHILTTISPSPLIGFCSQYLLVNVWPLLLVLPLSVLWHLMACL